MYVKVVDWKSCKDQRLAKEVKPDRPLIASLLRTSAKKLRSQALLKLDNDTAASKTTLAYDSLRELLEALALSRGYKIYNHESVLKRIEDMIQKIKTKFFK